MFVLQVNQSLHAALSDDQLWKPIFLSYRKYAYQKKDGVSFKEATLGINHVRFKLEHLFAQIFAINDKATNSSFQEGADPTYLKKLEERNGVSLPLFVKEYFLIVNGQVHISFNHGFLYGMRLLSVEEAFEGLDARKAQGKYLSDASSVGLPLTLGKGYSQIVASEKTGQIYLESGWNVFNRAANWYHFLHDFMASRGSPMFL